MLKLEPRQLYASCNPASLAAQLEAAPMPPTEALSRVAGQERALEAIDFGIAVQQAGFNVFALGPAGLGKSTAVLAAVNAAAQLAPPPSDWCYVNNFEDPHKPRALQLPAGHGQQFAQDMRELVEELESAVPAVFENDDTQARIQEIEEEFQERRGDRLSELHDEGDALDVAVIETPSGFTFAPRGRDHAVVTPEAYEALGSSEREKIRVSVAALQERLKALMRDSQTWRKEAREKIRSLHRELAGVAVGEQMTRLLERYAQWPVVHAHLDAVRTDVIDNVNDFLPQEQGPMAMFGEQRRATERYQVNVLVSRNNTDGAPVVHEQSPNHGNLIGRIEHRAHMGTLISDYTLIQPGALHRANGGYLVLDARRLLMQPFAWEALKATLRAREVRIEPLERAWSLTTPVTLEPEPIPLDVKVVLIGDRQLYYLLGLHDPEMRELFKVAADFDSVMDRTSGSETALSRQIVAVASTHELLTPSPDALARLMEHAARLAGDARKLSTHLGDLRDLLVEANHLGRSAGATHIHAGHVQAAIDAQVRRADRIRRNIEDAIVDHTLLIDTAGEAVGQVNGLSVMQLGGHSFGHPMRITATARLGKGEVIDIEHQTELGGPIHSKGVLILSNYLMARYGGTRPVSMTASVVIEQSYGGVEGDSASMAELCALLSALSAVPLKQAFAMTGSVNQLGKAQAIGGVNEKIEGFFDVCRRRGLDGSHGVIIPHANEAHLMLRSDVVEAVATGQFHVHSVNDVDEAMSLLTGIAAGAPDGEGQLPADSVNGRVQARLDELAEARRAFAGADAGSHANNGHKAADNG